MSTRAVGWGSDDLLERLKDERLPRGDLDDHARHFQRMTDDFVGHETLYLLYRFASGLAHPSVTVVDDYVTRLGEGLLDVKLLRQPGSHGDATWPWIVVWSLIWAGRALDYVTNDSPSRHFYQQMARESGMAGSTLELTKEAERLAWLDSYEAQRRRPSSSQ